MNAGLLNVLHDGTNNHLLTVAYYINIHFHGAVQERVQQYRTVVGYLYGVFHITHQLIFTGDNLHGPPTEHIGRTHHQRIADVSGPGHGLCLAAYGGVVRLQQAELVNHLLEAFAVFGPVNGVRAGADNGHTFGLQGASQLQRRLATVLDDNAGGLFHIDNGQHIFQRHRLKVEAVRGVVIGGDGLRVTVDHNGFVTVFPGSQRGMHTAVVKLDALTNAVWATADDHDLFPRRRLRLALFIIRRIHIRRRRLELGRTGVHPLIDRAHLKLTTMVTYIGFVMTKEFGQARIAEALLLETEQALFAHRVQRLIGQLRFFVHQVFNLHQEPRVNLALGKHLVTAHPRPKSIGHVVDAVSLGRYQFPADRRQRLVALRVRTGGEWVGKHGVKTGGPSFQPAQCFLYRLLKSTANGHHFTHGFHLSGQTVIGLGKLLKGKPGNLGDHVVDGRFKRRWHNTAGDLIAQLIQGVTHRQFRGHSGNGEAGGFGGQGGGA